MRRSGDGRTRLLGLFIRTRRLRPVRVIFCPLDKHLTRHAQDLAKAETQSRSAATLQHEEEFGGVTRRV